jgi:fructosamine-3-kinase
MLDLAKRDGAQFSNEKELRERVYTLLDEHEKRNNLKPCLVHGDLWSGNQNTLITGEPVIFDPAVYYGDPEVDISMTLLFGANSKFFYDSYFNEMGGVREGHEIRTTIYNLYHILNHYVLFGGGYLQQSYNMIDRILKY